MAEPRNSATKLSSLETAVALLTQTVTDFIGDSNRYRQTTTDENREQRRIHEAEQAKIWGEIRAQGDRFNTALEKLGSRGAITWPLIFMAGGFVLTIVATAATLGHFFVETRVRQLEISDGHLQRAADRQELQVEKLRDAEIEELRTRALGVRGE